jgi:hypothetical protein
MIMNFPRSCFVVSVRLYSITAGLISRSLLRKQLSQTSSNPSFPNASIGNPDETGTGPSIKTFAGDAFGIDSHRLCF